jgi:hypothetical protein
VGKIEQAKVAETSRIALFALAARLSGRILAM